MFEALSWRKPPLRTEVMHYAADGLAHARRNPIVLGSLAAVALLGALARIGFNRAWFNRTWSALNRRKLRSRATVIAARSRPNAAKAMPVNGRRRKRRKRKAATHA